MSIIGYYSSDDECVHAIATLTQSTVTFRCEKQVARIDLKMKLGTACEKCKDALKTFLEKE